MANKPGIWNAAPRDAFKLLQKVQRKDLNRLLDADRMTVRTGLGGR